jgi:hypothetical protein
LQKAKKHSAVGIQPAQRHSACIQPAQRFRGVSTGILPSKDAKGKRSIQQSALGT